MWRFGEAVLLKTRLLVAFPMAPDASLKLRIRGFNTKWWHFTIVDFIPLKQRLRCRQKAKPRPTAAQRVL